MVAALHLLDAPPPPLFWLMTPAFYQPGGFVCLCAMAKQNEKLMGSEIFDIPRKGTTTVHKLLPIR